MFTITPPNKNILPAIQQKIDQKTKPPGSLGKLENLATQLALITTQSIEEPIRLNKPVLIVFAGDHGIAEEGISIAPSEVTQQMVHNFIAGGAAINCFTLVNAMDLKIVDCGILQAIEHEAVISQRLGNGTQNLSTTMAMSLDQVQQGFIFAKRLIEELHEQGTNTIGIGEMGIGNTTSASALMAACLQLTAAECVGKGTGVEDDVVKKKQSLINSALSIHASHLSDPVSTLAALGGFEIVQMVGAMLAAAEKNMVIIVDGFISSSAAMMAHWINPAVKDYMVFAHHSDEQGHRRMLGHMNVEGLLDLNMRLGEGTGAALALNLLRAAASFYNDMASFESAGIAAV